MIRSSAYLAVRSAEPSDSQSGDDLVRIFGRSHNDMTGETNQIAQNKEPASTEKIGVWTAVMMSTESHSKGVEAYKIRKAQVIEIVQA